MPRYRLLVLFGLTAVLVAVGASAAWKRYNDRAQQSDEPEPSGFTGPRWELVGVEWSPGTLPVEGVEVRLKGNVATVYGPRVVLDPEGHAGQPGARAPRRGEWTEFGDGEGLPFGHQHHVGTLGISLAPCHQQTAEWSNSVPLNVCLNCHEQAGGVPPSKRPRLKPVREEKRSFLVKLDETASPKRIDLTECTEQGTVVPNGEKLIGIYKEEGADLVIAVTHPADEPDGHQIATRPTEFAPVRHDAVVDPNGRLRFRNAVFVLRLKKK